MVPLYLKVQQYLKTKIAEGTWLPGTMLPTEKELGAMFKVSRITVATAVKNLVAEGLVYRIAGKGSFVAQPRSEVKASELLTVANVIMPLQPQIANSEHKLIKISRIHPDPAMAQALQLEAQQVMIQVDRMFYVAEKPYFLERLYLPAHYFVELTDQELGELRVVELLTLSRLKLARTETSSTAVIATDEISKALEISQHTPVVNLTTAFYDIKGRPLAYAEVYNHKSEKQVFNCCN